MTIVSEEGVYVQSSASYIANEDTVRLLCLSFLLSFLFSSFYIDTDVANTQFIPSIYPAHTLM